MFKLNERSDLLNVAIIKVITFFINPLIVILIVQLYGKENFGIYTLLISTTLYLVTPIAYSINQLVFRERVLNDSSSIIRDSLTKFIYIALGTILLAYFIIRKANLNFSIIEIFFLAIIAICLLCAARYKAEVRSFGMIFQSQIFDLLIKIVFAFGLLLIFFINKIYYLYSFSPILIYANYAVGSFLALIFFVYFFHRPITIDKGFSQIEPSSKSMLKKSFKSFILVAIPSFGNLWYSEGIVVAFGIFGTIGDVAILKICLTITALMSAPLTIINLVYAKRMAENIEHYSQFIRYFRKARLLAFLGTLSICIILISFMPLIGKIFLVPTLERDNLTIIFLMFSFLISSWCGPVGQLMILIKKENKAMQYSLLSFLLSVVIFFLFVGIYGIHAAAFAILTGNAFVNIIFYFQVNKFFKVIHDI